MATSSKIVLTPALTGEYSFGKLTEASAKKASELLQENHDNHHIFFNKSGFHNHIAHHLLTIYALGASPEIIQDQYDRNASYQRAPLPVDDKVVEDLHDSSKFSKYLQNERYYHDYLVFFQEEIDAKGYEEVINEYVLKSDERAHDMLVRMYSGFLHPIIHLGFGVEFKQPAIVAEALAQAAAHDKWLTPFFLESEKKAKASSQPSKSLVELLDSIRADKKLSSAAHWDDDNKIRDGILVRAKDEMIKYASQWTAKPEELEEKTAEMCNAAVYFTGGAQHPPKRVKFDFYYMHCVNCSIFFSAFLKQPWISSANKVRLLEWKSRLDLTMYASRHCPPPLLDDITNYQPREAGKSGSAWEGIIHRVFNHPDDGHVSKLVRAIAHGAQVCKPFEGSEKFRINGKMWLQLGNMAIDSVAGSENDSSSWVRSAGFDQAWEKVEDRPRAQL
ncbi:hypothetical protein MMC32_004030 [Xylographa parallela]|nr:hypothetical protein [Xylographa parallela]